MLSLLLVALLPLGTASATTLANYTEKTMQKVGDTRLTWLIWDVYDAALYTPTGTFAVQQPFVLELTYLRTLNGNKVAQKTTEEMARLGFTNAAKLARWQLQLTNWFDGIQPGTRLAAMRNANGTTTFIRDGKQVLGTMNDTEFTQYFFAIWLSERTLRPDLRRELLGQAKVANR